MKKIIVPALALALSAVSAEAQSLYNAVYEKAKAAATPSANSEEARVNRFKLAALDYLNQYSHTTGKSSDSYFLDSQAVNLTSFIDDYLTNVQSAAKVSPAKRQEMIKCYANAAKSFPLNPDDSANAAAGAATTDELLPFPLATDWEKAYDKATSQARLVLKRK
jgi:hypothetical protein